MLTAGFLTSMWGPAVPQVVQALLAFLASSDIATVRQALAPYCGRMRLAPPGSVQEGLAMAVDMQDARGGLTHCVHVY